MKVIMRLYRQHDLDLIYLYKLKDFSFTSALKSSIRAYIQKQSFVIPMPDVKCQNGKITLPKQVQFHIILTEKNDIDIINFIHTISSGYRNSALKNIARCYLQVPSMTPYFTQNTLSFQNADAKSISANVKKKHGLHTTSSAPSSVSQVSSNDDIAAKVLHTPLPKGEKAPNMSESNDILTAGSSEKSPKEQNNFLDDFFSIVEEN
jgi:hypothetical protein